MQFLLKLLFAAFFILKLANVQPFNGWNWFLIFAPLAVHWLRVVVAGFWRRLWAGQWLAARQTVRGAPRSCVSRELRRPAAPFQARAQPPRAPLVPLVQ